MGEGGKEDNGKVVEMNDLKGVGVNGKNIAWEEHEKETVRLK